ncbi:nucleotide exchange factor GrpE [Streptomyces sp. NPDC102437]|uniref:nucleotide exchange factor GrpE n=1 Tax=Streptomyces sp. NPDC102437 TaxID=3366175 RepID=UPI0037F7C6D6
MVIRDKRRIDTLHLRDAGTKRPAESEGREHPGGTRQCPAGRRCRTPARAGPRRGRQRGATRRAGRTHPGSTTSEGRVRQLPPTRPAQTPRHRRSRRGRRRPTLLPVLDTIEQARAHDDAAAGFEAVADRMQVQLASPETLGKEGEPFDPSCHEALSSTESNRVDRPTCTHILRSGYRLGEILLRPAQVAVEQPLAPDHQTSGSSLSEGTGGRTAPDPEPDSGGTEGSGRRQ